MSQSSSNGRRVRVDRLDLDLHGIAPATAEAAVRELGPALARALTSRRPRGAAAGEIDAGRIASPASPGANDLADSIARRIAHALDREDK